MLIVEICRLILLEKYPMEATYTNLYRPTYYQS